nr:unnamed protein product [Callosobruchus analis]
MFIFREIFLTKFNLHFHAPINDSCKKYDLFENKLKYLVNEEEKRQLQIEWDLHHRKAACATDGMKRNGNKVGAPKKAQYQIRPTS